MGKECVSRLLCSVWHGTLVTVGGWLCVLVVIVSGVRPVPFRTRKLSPIALMVLHLGGCGRVGRRQPKT